MDKAKMVTVLLTVFCPEKVAFRGVIAFENERKSLLRRSQWSWLYGGKGANKKEIKYTGDLTRNGYFGSRMPTA